MIGISYIDLFYYYIFRLEDYDTIQPIFEELKIPKNAKILNIGCGNSEFSERLYDDGYTNNVNIDIAPNVIKYMNNRKGKRKGLQYEVMDVRDLKYKDETFDIVIDKSTIDALLCGEHAYMNVAKMTKEISRVLKTGGIYFIISYGKPENRILHLERDHLAFDIHFYSIKKEDDENNAHEQTQVHYGYICTKKPEAKDNLNNFDLVYDQLERDELEEANAEEEEEDDDEEGYEEQK